MFAEHYVSRHETSSFNEGTFADVIAYIVDNLHLVLVDAVNLALTLILLDGCER